MRVRRDAHAGSARDFNDGGDFLRCHLGRTGHAAKREYSSRGNDFDHVRAVVEDAPGRGSKFLGSAGYADACIRRNLCFIVSRDDEITAAARYGQIRPRCLDAWSGNSAGTNLRACFDDRFGKVVADIPDRSESGVQRAIGVGNRDLDCFR